MFDQVICFINSELLPNVWIFLYGSHESCDLNVPAAAASDSIKYFMLSTTGRKWNYLLERTEIENVTSPQHRFPTEKHSDQNNKHFRSSHVPYRHPFKEMTAKYKRITLSRLSMKLTSWSHDIFQMPHTKIDTKMKLQQKDFTQCNVSKSIIRNSSRVCETRACKMSSNKMA